MKKMIHVAAVAAVTGSSVLSWECDTLQLRPGAGSDDEEIYHEPSSSEMCAWKDALVAQGRKRDRDASESYASKFMRVAAMCVSSNKGDDA